MKKAAFCLSLLTLLSLSSTVFAEQPSCQYSSGVAPYCSYKGKVKRVYVNDRSQILLYFDTTLPVPEAEKVGYSITHGNAAIYKISNNADFAKMLYSTLLSANTQDRNVSIQMRGVTSGYMTIDRIWFGD
ncbi:hypothetical protein [Kangiella geojedonensis]|uniref:Uncharacterized protein n=1 Tax=Kangiella geojedonensis TaxID=914150 RepID=A0A0F6RBM8_9GAMM|nr:hypothetical protein [Kangiella geojedonensis]AKE51281.1 hypothetical protein TQ33_0293 [Kangiella geojedonensis]